MDLACAWSALSAALNYQITFGFVVFFQILIQFLRPDIVDVKNIVKVVAPDDILDSYDFVIIGAGSAGSVLANRLTENANWKVLLLEAGGSGSVIEDVPAMWLAIQQTDIDWQFETKSSTNYCRAMNNRRALWPRGKRLGGTSGINFMMYVRGNKKDYDGWRDLGNPGWGYDDVLPYFKKSENMTIPNLENSPYHETGGYLTVEEARYRASITENFLATGLELGYDLVDVNGESQTGFGKVQNTVRDGLRCDTAKAFLRPVTHRKNLYVSTNSMVDKILINEKTKTAYGVQFRRGGKEYVVYASTEVILSAGAINSPQILMLSGLGPKEHLEEVGIDVIQDIPGVGQNLQDHVTVGGLPYLYDAPGDTESVNSTVASGLFPLTEFNQFLIEQNGPMYGFLGSQAQAFINSGLNDHTLDYPDIQMVFSYTGDNLGNGLISEQLFGVQKSVTDVLYENIGSNNSYQIYSVVLRPKSSGYIKLRDANPNHHPIIVPNYFDHPEDMDVLVKALQIAHNISQTVAMKKVNARSNPNPTPRCGHYNPSYEFFECHARQFTMTAFHPTCTCKMGPADDTMAVVDSRLRVHGIKALRVVDASIMPNIVSGNTNAPTIMIAEKASDLIKEDHSDSYQLGRSHRPTTAGIHKRKKTGK